MTREAGTPERRERVFAVRTVTPEAETIARRSTPSAGSRAAAASTSARRSAGEIVELAPGFVEGGRCGGAVPRPDRPGRGRGRARTRPDRPDRCPRRGARGRPRAELARDELAARERSGRASGARARPPARSGIARRRHAHRHRERRIQRHAGAAGGAGEPAGAGAGRGARRSGRHSHLARRAGAGRGRAAAGRDPDHRPLLGAAERGERGRGRRRGGRASGSRGWWTGGALEVAFRVSTEQYARLLDGAGALRPLPVTATLQSGETEIRATGEIAREAAALGRGRERAHASLPRSTPPPR